MKTMKYKLMRRDRKNDTEFLIARFYCEGDALWAATVFEAHKVIGARCQCYVTDGKRISYPAGKLPANTFNLA